MKRLIILVLMVFSMDAALGCELTLPEDVLNSLELKNSGYKSMPVKFAYKNKKYKCEISADFNGDNKLDYAAIFVESSNSNYVPILFLSNENTFTILKIEDRYKYKYPNEIYFALEVIEPGPQQHWDKTINIQNPGIRLDVFEKPCCRFYWFEGELRPLENFG